METPPPEGEFLLICLYDGDIGSAIMNTLILTCVLFITMLLSITLLASSVRLLFTSDELKEMGIRLEPLEMQIE